MGRIAARLRDQGGIALIEMLVALPMTLIVVSAALSAVETIGAGQARTQGRAKTTIELKNRMERMTRELRQAQRVESVPAGAWNTNRVKLTICVDYEACATQRTIEYLCIAGFSTARPGGDSCFRSADGGAWQYVVDPVVLDQNVFRLYWQDPSTGNLDPSAVDPSLVRVRLKLDPRWSDQRRASDRGIVLEQAVPLENAANWEAS